MSERCFRRCVPGLLPVLTLCLFGGARCQAADGAAGEELRFFEQHVRPLLLAKCVKCHGPEKQESGLRLDSRTAILEGGDSGPAIVPGRIAESLLFEAVNYASLEMPPDGQLSDEEIAALGEWIRLGAPWTDSGVVDPVARSKITDDDRAFWSFLPIRDPAIPDVADGGWSKNAIDRFILARLEQAGLTAAAEADRETLIRRLYFDVVGLPPPPAVVDAFLADTAPDAYERLVDRLLASPRYGERWARHWLDLVRYGDSDGWRQDEYRPYAWRYRDYVIQAFNEDKPYDRFVTEQLAGDELAPEDSNVLVATGFLRHWVYEAEQRQVRMQWGEILDDITDVTGDVFLAMGMGCARCHDHKFDPILQKDYYRLQAFFAPLLLRDELPARPGQRAEYEVKLARWQEATRELRQQINTLEDSVRAEAVDREFRLFPQDIKDLWRRRDGQLTPYEFQMVSLVERKLSRSRRRAGRRLMGEAKAKWDKLTEQLAAFEQQPPLAPAAMVVRDVGGEAPSTYLDKDPNGEVIEPGFLSVLDPEPATIEPVPTAPGSSGRRTALAHWITSPQNPLTSRVIVNRIWQYHFGEGLVSTPSDFGRLGQPPSHPDLLDWLASRFMRDGWSLKELHRLILTSATYRQTALREMPAAAMQVDSENRLLWRMHLRRLGGEQIRDAMLAVTGELDLAFGGPGDDPEAARRSIFTKVIRNTPFPLLRAFDVPDGFSSTSHRDITTTSTQALLMINGPWVLARAEAWADRLWHDHQGSLPMVVVAAYRSGIGQQPDPTAQREAMAFLNQQAARLAGGEDDSESTGRQALVDFCHVLLNSNEFLYVD